MKAIGFSAFEYVKKAADMYSDWSGQKKLLLTRLSTLAKVFACLPYDMTYIGLSVQHEKERKGRRAKGIKKRYS